ncbi:unnamed protein product [Ranitomeya imitator]|uniref:Transposase Tc1-like domain-containing protein n=1 Tax=Ranitomeya imitator TaxID=111125 RepID=A0ABN9M786_9NEOB|nr:unnamed protein product [Ranitomeya imitator]
MPKSQNETSPTINACNIRLICYFKGNLSPELDLKSRKRLFKKTAASLASYEHYRSPQSPHRQGRSFGIPKHNIMSPEIPFYHNSGKRCYQSFDNYSYRTRSYTRSRRQMPCVNKECQFGFMSDRDEEQRGLEETITYYEIEEADETPFSPLSNPGSPMVPAPGFWVARSNPGPIGPVKQNLNSSEEDIDEPSDNGEYHGDFMYTSDGAFENSTYIDEVSRPLPSQEDVPYKFTEQVSSVISTSCVNSAPATVISSSSAVGVPSTVTSTVLPQTAVQPIVVSQSPTGRPVTPGPGEMGDCTIPLPPPPYSCDPSGSDLPRDTKVLQYYFNLGLQCNGKNHQALQRNWLTRGRPRKGRQSPLLLRISFIRVTSLRNRRLTAAQVRDQVNATHSSSSRHISTTTVKRRLCAAGLHGKIAARKPLLRTGNKQKRLVWAKEHKEWTLDQWKSVLWSDQSKFEIFGSNHRVFV